MKTMHDLILAAQAGWEYRMEHGKRLSEGHTGSVYICDTLHYQAHLGLDEQFGHLLVEVRLACDWIKARIEDCFSAEQYVILKMDEANLEALNEFLLVVDADHPAVINERRKLFAELLVKYPVVQS
ncbi:hypothetical protein [Ferribacterium limneticum]|uniref:hypothetical protein n=1 Tax=Ferribacterium limneticum TaxID=76259 RepID=UPI001CF7FCCD|nr:hypothetical protein [Ferribacterium limneticum]UCV26763.1 hypothetical protein KI617_10620 [Ferribacterium limneticum]UCV30680.1 hypothetical protein KI608_10620 [Ferribacterium limneticum]